MPSVRPSENVVIQLIDFVCNLVLISYRFTIIIDLQYSRQRK